MPIPSVADCFAQKHETASRSIFIERDGVVILEINDEGKLISFHEQMCRDLSQVNKIGVEVGTAIKTAIAVLGYERETACRRESDLIESITSWGHKTGIIKHASAKDQALKLVSEVGELCDAILKGTNEHKIKDGIGDSHVVLIMLAGILGYSTADMLQLAYDEIKDRQGVLCNGAFIKMDDAEFPKAAQAVHGDNWRNLFPNVKG